MTLTPPIFLAASEGVGLDLVVWLIAGAIWLFGQIATARKNKEKKAPQSRAESSTSSTLQPGGGPQDCRLRRAPIVRGRPGWAMSALVKKLRVRSYS